jgi:RuvA, C-terminal domain
MTQTIAFLASGALLAFAIATLLAGRSLWFIAQTVIGWSAAVLALVLALAAFALIGFHYLTDHAPTAPVSGALGVGGALIVIGVAAKVARRRRKPTRAPARTAAPAPRTASKRPPAATPALTCAARDAIVALAGLGYARKDAATMVTAAISSLGVGADVAALVKAALRARNLSRAVRA